MGGDIEEVIKMVLLRELTDREIEKLASRPKVKRIACENFLMTNHYNQTSFNALGNLDLDAGLYKWNKETINAIRDGIMLAGTGGDKNE